MKLLYTLTAYPPYTGGAQLHQHMLAQQLSSHHNIQVVSQWDTNRTDWLLGTTLFAPSQARNYSIDGVPVHRIGLSIAEKAAIAPYIALYYPLMDLALPPIAKRLEQHLDPYSVQADLIHNVRIGREGLSYASLYAARKRNIPFVLTPVHHPRWTGWRYRAYNRLYKMADAIFALTHTEKQTLISLGIDENRITVTGTGPIISSEARPTEFMKEYKIGGPFVLFIGQHYPYKGYKQILQAANLVWKKIPEAEFVFIGPAVKKSEQDFIAYQDRRIHRLGSVALQTKTDALAACTVFCMPSTQESFGIVYTETWSFSKPVIGCNIPAVAEVIENGVNGYLVEQEPGDIAEKIIYLLLNSSVAHGLGKAGKARVEERYNWQRIAQITERVYLNLR
jgi:glycosyltransferase involved in cell wall biosynthesis